MDREHSAFIVGCLVSTDRNGSNMIGSYHKCSLSFVEVASSLRCCNNILLKLKYSHLFCAESKFNVNEGASLV